MVKFKNILLGNTKKTNQSSRQMDSISVNITVKKKMSSNYQSLSGKNKNIEKIVRESQRTLKNVGGRETGESVVHHEQIKYKKKTLSFEETRDSLDEEVRREDGNHHLKKNEDYWTIENEKKRERYS